MQGGRDAPKATLHSVQRVRVELAVDGRHQKGTLDPLPRLGSPRRKNPGWRRLAPGLEKNTIVPYIYYMPGTDPEKPGEMLIGQSPPYIKIKDPDDPGNTGGGG